jgi:hypothetical protein
MTAPWPGSPQLWGRRNLRLLAVFSPVLIATGLAGLLLPAPPADLASMMMSNARPYDAFHIAFGLLGGSLVVTRRIRASALFNLGFGAFDLYQAAAGLLGIFPSGVFDLRPADHVVHVVLGALLAGFGARFFFVARAETPRAAAPFISL